MVTYPSDWEETELKDICSYVNGTSLEEFFSHYGERRVVSLGNYSETGKYIDDGNRICLNEKTRRFTLEKNNLAMVLNDKGNGRLVGRVLLIDYDNTYIFNQRSLRIILNESETYPQYMYFLINSNIYRNDLTKHIQGNTQVYINPPAAMSIEVHLPPLSEQQAIASVLSDIDEHIDNLTELIEKKKAIRDGALEDLISGMTRLEGFHGDWTTLPFGQYFSMLPTNTYSREQLSDSGEIGNIHYGDVLIKYGCVLSENDCIPRVIDTSKLNAKHYLRKNDVIIADTAEDDTVGKAVQVGEIGMPLVSGLHTMACRPNYPTADGFLGYYINSNCYHDQLLPYITGIKVSSISKKAIGDTFIRIPMDIKEQETISSVLTVMDEEIEALEEEKAKMIGIKEGAMDDLLTGRVRLKV